MSSRKFNLICIAALIVVAALAMLTIGLGQEPASATELQETPGAMAPSNLPIQPLSLGLSVTIVADMGLMTLGLVILFKDEAPGRYRAR